MAAFPSRDRAAFDAHWATNILGNPAAVTRTILVDGQVAGNDEVVEFVFVLR